MEDRYQLLHDRYQQVAYGERNRLDGVFAGMMVIYERMYGRFMPEDKNARIVDIACGAGQFVRYCLNKGYVNTIGVDLSTDQVRYCQTHVAGHVMLKDGLEFLAENPENLDLVVANDFIEHLNTSDGIKFCGLVKDALKPGGRIILKTANMAAFGGIVMRYNTLDHETGYTEVSLRSLLGIHEYQDIEIIPYGTRTITQKIGMACVNFVIKQLYKYLYMGNYPRYYDKIIAVTGVKA